LWGPSSMLRTALILQCSAAGALHPWQQPLRRVGALVSTVRARMQGDADDYGDLRGLPTSLGRDAAEWAVAGIRPTRSNDGRYMVATFAGGCFWGTELHYQRLPGVIATAVGYTEGRVPKPTYKQVCTGRTGHTEACQLLYDPEVVTFSELCDTLFKTIDPTKRDQVGNDYGTQYRHGIYCHSEEQLAQAKAYVARAGRSLPAGKSIVTEVKRATVFWPAEEYHQQYLSKGGRFGSGQSAVKGCRDPVRCYG